MQQKPRPDCWICHGHGKITLADIHNVGNEEIVHCLCTVMTQHELITFAKFCQQVNDAWADLPDEIRAKFDAVLANKLGG